MSLANKSVVVTRPREQSDVLVAEIEAHGGRAVVAPMITIADPVSWAECDSAIAALGTFDELVFTSINGVDRFFGRCRERGVGQEQIGRLTTYAVGEKTRHAIESYGAHVAFTPEDFSSEVLGHHFASRSLAGHNVLIVRGDRGKKEIEGILRDRGASVTAVIVYRTLPVAEADSLGRQLLAGSINALTFASPSAVRQFRELFPEFTKGEQHVVVAVIGPTTEHAAQEAGLAPDVIAPQATAESLVQALDDYFANKT